MELVLVTKNGTVAFPGELSVSRGIHSTYLDLLINSDRATDTDVRMIEQRGKGVDFRQKCPLYSVTDILAVSAEKKKKEEEK